MLKQTCNINYVLRVDICINLNIIVSVYINNDHFLNVLHLINQH